MVVPIVSQRKPIVKFLEIDFWLFKSTENNTAYHGYIDE